MRLAPLLLIELAAFLLIIGETYVFFALVVPLGPITHDPFGYTAYTLLKIALTFGLGVLWFVAIAALTRAYVKSKVRRRTPTSSP